MLFKKADKGSKLIKNIFLMFTGNFVTKILSFFMVPFYTSVLSTDDYGVADLISTTVLLVLPIFSMLMEESVLRFALDNSKDNSQVFSIAMFLSTLGFAVAMIVSPIILLFDSLRNYYWFVVLYYVSLWFYNIFSFYVRGLDKVAIATVASIIHTFAYLLINIVSLAVLKWGIYGYLLAIDISNIIASIFLFFYCKLYKDLVSFRKIDFKLAKDMLKYSIPMIPNYISGWLNGCLDRYILAFFCGNSAVGLYSVSHKIPTILNSLISIFSSAWRISSVDDFGSQESIKFFNRIYKIYGGFLFMGSSILILFTKLIATVLFAKDFFISWKITPWLLLANVICALALFFESIFTASKKTKKLFLAPMFAAICNLVLNIILIPKYSTIGAAIATTIGYTVMWITQMFFSRKLLKMNLNLRILIPSYILILLEILFILKDDFVGNILGFICAILIIVINFETVIYLLKFSYEKLNNKKSKL